MSIEDKIREAFSKTTSLKEATKWSSNTQPNNYELDNFLRKSGYQLIDVLKYESKAVELIIEPIKESYLTPEIFHDIEEGNFYAKVVEHGMLIASDLEEIIKGYTTATGVLKHLESLDLEKLEAVITEK